jgi:hypothetical protein
MGLARDLSMGKRRPKNRIGQSGDWAVLRRLTDAPNPDLDHFRTVLDRVGTGPRMRYAEVCVYVAACTRYRELTGQPYGPTQGIRD